MGFREELLSPSSGGAAWGPPGAPLRMMPSEEQAGGTGGCKTLVPRPGAGTSSSQL